jgi:hypothetical protein
MSLGARRLHSARRHFEDGVRRGERPAKLFYNLEDSPLAVARGRTGKQRANSLNGLTASANDTADIPASKLQFKDSRPAAWNFCQHHIVRKFNQLPNDELEKFLHASEN